MRVSNELLACPAPALHMVQLYTEVEGLVASVTAFLVDGLRRGEPAIVIATPDHRERFARALREQGADVDTLRQEGRLTMLDAEETLGVLCRDGEPDEARFHTVIGTLVRDTLQRFESAPLRAYGEMVELLRRAGAVPAAARLETLWNDLLAMQPFSLFCAYEIDVLASDTEVGCLEQMLGSHSHLVPCARHGGHDAALERAMIEVLGPDSLRRLQPLFAATQYPRPLRPGGEATILWLRRHMPALAEEVLAHARGQRLAAGVG